jgi:hypothetical protein
MIDIHQDELVRVTHSVGSQTGGVPQSLFVTIDRENRNTARQWIGIQPALRTGDGIETHAPPKVFDVCRAAETCIDPEFERWKHLIYFTQQIGMAAEALDSVEVGQVKAAATEFLV